MKLSSYLLFTTLTLGTLLSSSTDALAFGGRPGGPFSNGSYFPSDGTFSAVIRGRTDDSVMVGTMQFSTTSGSGPLSASTTTQQNQTQEATTQLTTTETQGTGGVGSTGICTLYLTGGAFGNAYFGNSQGSLDPAASKLTVAFQASAQGQGEQTVTQTQTISLTSGNTTTEDIVNSQIVKYFDSFFISGSSICSASNSFPNQKFSGSGVAEGVRLEFGGRDDEPSTPTAPYKKTEKINFSVTGVRLSNINSSFETKSVRPPTVNIQKIFLSGNSTF